MAELLGGIRVIACACFFRWVELLKCDFHSLFKKWFALGISRNLPFGLIFALREVNDDLPIAFVLPFQFDINAKRTR